MKKLDTMKMDKKLNM